MAAFTPTRSRRITNAREWHPHGHTHYQQKGKSFGAANKLEDAGQEAHGSFRLPFTLHYLKSLLPSLHTKGVSKQLFHFRHNTKIASSKFGRIAIKYNINTNHT